MTAIPTREYLERFAEALVSEIKAEMGRRDLSYRGLATLLGENPQYVTSRLGGGNPRTKKRVDISVSDLVVIASAFNLDADDLLGRAFAVAGEIVFMQVPDTPAGVELARDELASRRDSAPLRAQRKALPKPTTNAARTPRAPKKKP